MTILSALGRLAQGYSKARARHLTERAISTLPIELQKDIGWPDAFETRSTAKIHLGSWAGGR